MKHLGKVAVLLGGDSSEREVSLLSGNEVYQGLLQAGVDAHLYDTKEQSLFDLKQQGFERVFIVLHGGAGEDGRVQAVLESMGLPYTGCGMLASGLGMDKLRSKMIWQAAGLPVPDFAVLQDDTDFDAVEVKLGLPMFVKPAAEGSSVGVVKVMEKGALAAVYQDLKQYRGAIIAETFIGGGEYTCGILGNEALPSIKIVPKTEFYDYEAKYFRDDTEYLCPADLSDADEALMCQLALQAFQVIGGRGWGRVDFLRGVDGRLYLLEINTVPGMTTHSLVPKAAAQTGRSFSQLCLEILEHATLG